jgi:hypothetical protein
MCLVAGPKMSYSGTGINDLIITEDPPEWFAFPRAPREKWTGIAGVGRSGFDEGQF